MSETEKEIDWIAIQAGRAFNVLRMDGTTESVHVRAVGLNKAKDVLTALGDHAAAVEKFTGKKADWCTGIQPDSLFDLIEEGVKLNEPFFLAWKKGMERVGKTVNEALGLPTPPAL